MRHFLVFVLMAFSISASAQQDYFYVATGDSMPYLNYGLGTDRLGGAKMTFLDSNIILKVVDSTNQQYKVQLSTQHVAWIPKDKVKTPSEEVHSDNLTGSWLIAGDSLSDFVAISMPQKLPYRSWMDINPSRIVVDVFGVNSNTNWITQRETAREIKNVWYNQIEDDVMQVYIELNHPTHWGYHIYYDSLSRLTVRVKRQPNHLSLRDLKIAVDAGHGGDQTGARGIKSQGLEKNYTLAFAKELQKELTRRGSDVVMTREKDTTLSMFERLQFLQKENPDLLVSIHFNSAGKDTVSGVSTYYRYVGFRPLSQFILHQMKSLGLKEFGNVGGFNFSLSGPTEYPNCLVEVAFLSNPEDEARIKNPQFAREVARRITAGIEDFLDSIKD